MSKGTFKLDALKDIDQASIEALDEIKKGTVEPELATAIFMCAAVSMLGDINRHLIKIVDHIDAEK